jgi:single-strand DNA-binding protein
MSSLPYISATGNLTRPPELRFTAAGKPVVSLTVAVSNGKRDDPQTKTTFLNCTAWDTMAENIANTLTQGQRVNIVGQLEQRSFETKEGEKRTVMEVRLESIGPDLRFGDTPSGGGSRPAVAPSDDPWGSNPPTRGGFTSEPPFLHHTPIQPY